MEDAAPGAAQVPKALTRPPGAFLELLNPPEEDVPMEELLTKDEEELPMSDTKWQRRRELMAKGKEQASSEEDENPCRERLHQGPQSLGGPLPVQRGPDGGRLPVF